LGIDLGIKPENRTKHLGLCGLLEEEAVISEPVSARWFPVPREKTGKFAYFGLEIAKVPGLSEENSITYQQNSLVAKAGKISWLSGNLKRVTANLIRITGYAVAP
jgi:hypothetical protein